MASCNPTTVVSSSTGSYKPPTFETGQFTLNGECNTADSNIQEQYAVENLNISGAPVNIFKLLGVHEQGKLIDLTGNGHPLGLNDPSRVFDANGSEWQSSESGLDVSNSFVGYDFGTRKTSYGQEESEPGIDVVQHITSLRIQQGDVASTRALQIRVEHSNGEYFVDTTKTFGVGNIAGFTAGPSCKPGVLTCMANSATDIAVMFTDANGSSVIGSAKPGQRFNSSIASFTVSGNFAANDILTAEIELVWKRVDIINLPDMPTAVLLPIKASSPARYWRIVPTSFAGALSNDHWVIQKLELFDYQQTTLDNIQDPFYLENRDRDYATASVQLKMTYTPFDAMNDLSKFGFQIADIYTFTTTFATMVSLLGRPIVVGDVLELPSEIQYDHNLRPIKRFLEVSDASWDAQGYTTDWRPVIFKFQAQQLIAGQEHRDLFGTPETQKFIQDDNSFFTGIQQLQDMQIDTVAASNAEAKQDAPKKGTNVRENAEGLNRFDQPGSTNQVGIYVEDGLPPNGEPYQTGFGKLPDVAGVADGAYFRLEYDPKLSIPARLYKFSGMKNKWIFQETDRRNDRSAHTKSQLEILERTTTMKLDSKL